VNVALALASLLFSPGCSGDKGTIDLLPSQEVPPRPSTCTDGLLDGNETDLDCGGDCAGCGIGKICEEAADCEAGTTCVGTKCR